MPYTFTANGLPRLEATVGNDVISGLGGSVSGGLGHDRFVLSGTAESRSTVYGNRGQDFFQLTGSYGAETPAVALFGQRGADTFTLYRGGVLADGGKGNDEFRLVLSASGTSTLDGGLGIDTLRLLGQPHGTSLEMRGSLEEGTLWRGDTLVAELAGLDRFDLALTGRVEGLKGGARQDEVSFEGDYISADMGAGRDRVTIKGDVSGEVDMGKGRDLLVFVANPDQALTLDGRAGTAHSTAGTSLSFSKQEMLLVIGSNGGDVLRGSGGLWDDFSGGAGDDRLDGRRGEDTLRGGTGQDTLRGGLGADHFIFDIGAEGFDLVEDASAEDRFELTGAPLFENGFPDPATQVLIDVFPTTTAPSVRYDSVTGQLSYDQDGRGPLAAEVLAVLLNGDDPAEVSLGQIQVT